MTKKKKKNYKYFFCSAPVAFTHNKLFTCSQFSRAKVYSTTHNRMHSGQKKLLVSISVQDENIEQRQSSGRKTKCSKAGRGKNVKYVIKLERV